MWTIHEFFNMFSATWVDRFSIDSDEEHSKEQPYILTPMQISKYTHFFTNLLDHDQDNLICEQDFEALIEVSFVQEFTVKTRFYLRHLKLFFEKLSNLSLVETV